MSSFRTLKKVELDPNLLVVVELSFILQIQVFQKHPFNNLFSKYLLSIYFVLGLVINIRNRVVNRHT